MIEINLLPGARKRNKSRTPNVDVRAILGDLAARVKDPFLIAALASVIVAVLAVGGMWTYQSRTMATLQEKEAVALQDSARFTAVIAQRASAEASRDSVVRQITVIKAIDGLRYVWPHIMEEVSRALPPYTWIKALHQTSAVALVSAEIEAEAQTIDGKPKSKMAKEADSAAVAASKITFRIVGQTVDIQALTRFMKSLEASPWIERVQLAKTEAVMAQPYNKEATEFTLDMQLQKPDSAAIRRVPLAATVR